MRLDTQAQGLNDGSGINLLDFKLDSTNMQVFEGVDYQEEKARRLEAERLMALELVTAVAVGTLFLYLSAFFESFLIVFFKYIPLYCSCHY